MAKAIFHKKFNYSRKSGPTVGWAVKPSNQPQEFPEDLVAAAVAAGCATRVPRRRAARSSVDRAIDAGARQMES